MELDDVKAEHARLGEWAHLATTSPDGGPHVTPVHPCWEGDTLWVMVGVGSVKVRNLRADPRLVLHWQVGMDTNFDSLMLWGTGEVFTDVETKRRLWDGVFDYDLSMFAPDGPDASPDTAFLAITPSRALVLRFFGSQGREVWEA